MDSVLARPFMVFRLADGRAATADVKGQTYGHQCVTFSSDPVDFAGRVTSVVIIDENRKVVCVQNDMDNNMMRLDTMSITLTKVMH